MKLNRRKQITQTNVGVFWGDFIVHAIIHLTAVLFEASFDRRIYTVMFENWERFFITNTFLTNALVSFKERIERRSNNPHMYQLSNLQVIPQKQIEKIE